MQDAIIRWGDKQVSDKNGKILSIDGLKVTYGGESGKNPLRAVDGVSLDVGKGESVGLVGESGCGKSSLANAFMGLVPATGGTIAFQGNDVTAISGRSLKDFRTKVQMIFQDPLGSLNPRISVGGCLAEVCRLHNPGMGRAAVKDRVIELLDMVGLESVYANRYPHEFSGGQRQRIGIARALAVNPSLIIADEPVSALDVSVQVQILNLMKSLQKKMDLSYLFIAHDLAVVRYMCARICVMYLGRIVEASPAKALFDSPAHPYTEALLSAVPDVEKGLRTRSSGSERIVLTGDVPSAAEHISGCPFHTRCHRVQDICKSEVPPRKEVDEGRFAVCHFELCGRQDGVKG